MIPKRGVKDRFDCPKNPIYVTVQKLGGFLGFVASTMMGRYPKGGGFVF